MICPKCGGKTYVVETRTNDESVYRRRKCKDCKHLIFTAERECDPFQFHQCQSEYYALSKERRKKNG